MDLLCKRFPLLNKMILSNLNNQSLIRSKKVSREITRCLNKQRFYWIRLIKKFSKKFEGHEESWREALNKIPVAMIKQLASAVLKFFKIYTHEKLAPLHYAVASGNLQLSEYLISKTKQKNPQGRLWMRKLEKKQLDGHFIIRWKIKGVISEIEAFEFCNFHYTLTKLLHYYIWFLLMFVR